MPNEPHMGCLFILLRPTMRMHRRPLYFAGRSFFFKHPLGSHQTGLVQTLSHVRHWVTLTCHATWSPKTVFCNVTSKAAYFWVVFRHRDLIANIIGTRNETKRQKFPITIFSQNCTNFGSQTKTRYNWVFDPPSNFRIFVITCVSMQAIHNTTENWLKKTDC